MKKYKVNFESLEKFLQQNEADVIDCSDGVLIDNLLLATKRGYIALIETYVNCWSSCYTLYFDEQLDPVYEVFEKTLNYEND